MRKNFNLDPRLDKKFKEAVKKLNYDNEGQFLREAIKQLIKRAEKLEENNVR